MTKQCIYPYYLLQQRLFLWSYMSLEKRVNLKRFFLISIPTFAVFIYLCKDQRESLAMLGVYLATIVNFWMLINIIEYLAQSVKSNQRANISKWKVAGFFVGKMLALLVALTLSVQIMGDRLLIPVLSYVIQIFVLGVSLRRY